MTITFTTPTVRSDVTKKRLVTFHGSVLERKISVLYETGYLDGSGAFIKLGELGRIFTDDTIPSFANFVAACPAAGQLRRQVETYETTLAEPGAVD